MSIKILVHYTVLSTKGDKKKQNTFQKNVIYGLITFMNYKNYIFRQSQNPQLIVHLLVNLQGEIHVKDSKILIIPDKFCNQL